MPSWRPPSLNFGTIDVKLSFFLWLPFVSCCCLPTGACSHSPDDRSSGLHRQLQQPFGQLFQKPVFADQSFGLLVLLHQGIEQIIWKDTAIRLREP